MTSQLGNNPSEGDPNGMSIGYAGARIATRGWPTIGLILLVILVALNLWIGRGIEQAIRETKDVTAATLSLLEDRAAKENTARQREHMEIQKALTQAYARTSCVLSLTPAERVQFRGMPGTWSRWCWWVED